MILISLISLKVIIGVLEVENKMNDLILIVDNFYFNKWGYCVFIIKLY